MSKINKDRENNLSWDRLYEVIEYNPDTGEFTNKISGIRRIKGSRAGSITSHGYYNITIDNMVFRAHRLAWFYSFKEWPIGIIDHIDQDKLNNRLDNLREATETKNKYNTKIQSNNTSGFRGVSFDTHSGKYKASIRINRVLKNLGRYNTAEEAAVAYNTAAKEIQQEFYSEDTM